jgi:hypothetical protein
VLAFSGHDRDDSILSEPPDGLGSCLPSSADVFFQRDNGVHPVSIPSNVVTDDSIPSKPPDRLGPRLSTSTDDRVADDVGITSAHPLSLTNDLGAFHDKVTGTTPGEMSRLHEYNAFHDKGMGKTPDGEQIKKISWLPALADDDRFTDDVGITPLSIPSEPPRPGSRLSYSADDLFKNNHGIHPGMADDLIEQSMTKLVMGRLHGYDTFHGVLPNHSTNTSCTMLEYDRGSYPIMLLGWGRTQREREREGESRPFCRR